MAEEVKLINPLTKEEGYKEDLKEGKVESLIEILKERGDIGQDLPSRIKDEDDVKVGQIGYKGQLHR